MKNNIQDILRRTAAAMAVMLTAVFVSSCESKDVEGSTVTIVDDLYEVDFTAAGGTQSFIVYSDVGDWELKPTYEEDWEWITAWPASGRNDARFSIKVDENKSAYPRTCDLHIVANGKIAATITFNQDGAEPYLELLYSNETKLASSLGEEFKIKVSSNIDWSAEIPEDAGWLTLGEHTDEYQIFAVEENTLEQERTTTVTFSAPGASLSKTLTVKQAKPSESFHESRKVSIADILAMTGGGAGTVEENVYVEAYVVSDYTSGNFPPACMCVQDESGKGLCIEFDDESSNDYALNSKLTIHLYGMSASVDSENGAPVFDNFTRTMIMKNEESTGIAPIEIDDVSTISDHEYCLVKLRNVEYVVPYGTYLNINETALNADYAGYDITNSLPFSEKNNEYVQLLRDAYGNVTQLYTFHSFIYRASRMVPEGTGDITGVVMRRIKNEGTVYHIRMRNLEDDAISDDPSTRRSKTVMQIGPWTEYQQGLEKATASIGIGQLKESATGESIAVNSSAGNASMYFQPAWTRSCTASLVDGTWIPLYANSTDVIYYCITAQDWWQNNYNRIEDCDGTAWILPVSTAGYTEQLSLDFAAASSSSGPLNFCVEWSTDENAPLDYWTEIATYAVTNASTSQAMKLYTIDLPQECCDRSDLVLRMRVYNNRRAKNTSTPIDRAGTSRLGIIRISSR